MNFHTQKTQTTASVRRAGITAVLAACVAVIAAPAVAQGTSSARIGFVSTERIMRDSTPAKAAQSKIEKDFSRRDKEIQDLAARLRSASERFEKDGAVMSDSDRARRQRELSDMDRDLQRRQREFREDLNQRRNEELSSVLDKANRAIKSIAEREKFDLILQDAVYVSPRLDITDAVIKQLNAGR
ncbi:MAG: OmpH family outer membrane protein [Lautropia sp.]|nr:OmpH family outer membrane protein [Lautropia sp.]